MSSTKCTLHKTFGIDVAAHGDLTGTEFDPTVNLEVISLGLSRTGTTSLQLALTKLGLGPSHQGVDLFRNPARREAFIDLDEKLLNRTWQAGDPALSARLRDLMRGYRSSTDNPICFLPDEVYAAFPKAKYILTTRPDGKQGWWKSINDAAGWHCRQDVWQYVFRFLIWPVTFLRRTDDKVRGMQEISKRRYGAWDVELYDKHNAHVQELIPKDHLLVYDVREGWEPLCEFLKVPVPNEEFPRLNETGAMQSIYFGMMAYGAFHWAMYAGTAAAMVYIMKHPEVVAGVFSRLQDFIQGTLQRIGLR